MHTLNKLSACILTGTLILSGMTSNVKADETRINTDHNTYYIGNVEYNEDGTIVDASHVCNMQVETPPTTDGNDTEVTPDPEPSEPTEPVTPAPTPDHSHLKRMEVQQINQKHPILITTIKRKVQKNLASLRHQQERSRLFLMRMKEMKRLIFQLIKLWQLDISVPLKTH